MVGFGRRVRGLAVVLLLLLTAIVVVVVIAGVVVAVEAAVLEAVAGNCSFIVRRICGFVAPM